MMKWYYWVATVAYCAFIFFLSSRQDLPDAPVDIPSIDKMFHFVAYGGLAGLVSWGMRQSNESLAPRVQWVAPVLFAVLYGLSDEITSFSSRTARLTCGILPPTHWARWPHNGCCAGGGGACRHAMEPFPDVWYKRNGPYHHGRTRTPSDSPLT